MRSVHDLIIKGGTARRRDGCPRERRRTSRSTPAASPRSAQGRSRAVAAPDHRRRRPARHARCRRHPHALRRPGHLGPRAGTVVVARRDDARHGQLRRGLRPGRSRSPRLAHRHHGGRRGHPPAWRWPRGSSGSGRRSASISTHSSVGALDGRCRHPDPARRRAGVRDGRAGAPRTSRRTRRTSRRCVPSCWRACAGVRLEVLDVRARSGIVAIDGEVVPGTYAAEDDRLAWYPGALAGEGARGPASSSSAPYGVANEHLDDPWQEVDWMRRLSANDLSSRAVRALAGRRGSRVVAQAAPGRVARRARRAPQLYPQVAGRATGVASRGTSRRSTSSPRSQRTWSCASGTSRRPPGAGRAGEPRGAALDRVVDLLHRRRWPRRWRRHSGRTRAGPTRSTSRDRSARWPGWRRREGSLHSRWPTTRWRVTAAPGCCTSRS